MADRWATYEEAGEAFGLSADAMRKRARRLGWRVTSGNDGKARVLIPDGADLSPDGRGGRPAGRPDGRGDDRADGLLAELRRRLEAAEAHHDNLATEIIKERERRARIEGERDTERLARIAAEGREAEALALMRHVIGQLDAAHRERAEAVAGSQQLQGRADRAEADAAALRELAKAERGRAELAQDAAAARLHEAQAARDAARAELAGWTAGGPLARAWRAFLSRRGRP